MELALAPTCAASLAACSLAEQYLNYAQGGQTEDLLADIGAPLLAGGVGADAAGGLGRSASSGPQTLKPLRPGAGNTTQLLNDAGQSAALDACSRLCLRHSWVLACCWHSRHGTD